ncbi:MAG: cytochrome c [Pseudomonadota bacterium]
MRLTYIVLFTLWPALSGADDLEAQGKRLFALHCAACHGEDARGTGSVGTALDTNPADLTVLARNNGGAFPVLRVVARIDGRVAVKAHDATMPAYGYFFDGPVETLQTASGDTVQTTRAIAQIVTWLKSMQR